MTGNGTILGRSPNLILGFLTAAFNALVIFHIAGFDPTLEQVASVNVLLGAGVLVIANVPEVAVAAGIKAITRLNNATSDKTTPGTDLANQVINGDGIHVNNISVTNGSKK